MALRLSRRVASQRVCCGGKFRIGVDAAAAQGWSAGLTIDLVATMEAGSYLWDDAPTAAALAASACS